MLAKYYVFTLSHKKTPFSYYGKGSDKDTKLLPVPHKTLEPQPSCLSLKRFHRSFWALLENPLKQRTEGKPTGSIHHQNLYSYHSLPKAWLHQRTQRELHTQEQVTPVAAHCHTEGSSQRKAPAGRILLPGVCASLCAFEPQRADPLSVSR